MALKEQNHIVTLQLMWCVVSLMISISPAAAVLHQPAGAVTHAADGQPGVCQVFPATARLHPARHTQEI